MAKSRGFTPDQKQAMRTEYESGVTLTVLGKKWNVSAPTMADYIRHAGGSLRNRGTPKKAEPRKIQSFDDVRPVVTDPVSTTSAPVPVTLTEAKPEVSTPQAPVARRILPFE